MSVSFPTFDARVKQDGQLNGVLENQENEHKILCAAKQVFIEKGLDGAKMSDIAERAGISRTALNYYYRTKENLFYAIIEQVFDLLLPRVENISSLKGDAAAKVDAVVEMYDNMLRQNEYMPRFVFVEIQRNPQLMYDFIEQSDKAQAYLKALSLLLGTTPLRTTGHYPKTHLITVFFGLQFVPYLLEPLLALYRDTDCMERDTFLDEHKAIVKKLLKAYFE